jgi:hypothetical protein
VHQAFGSGGQPLRFGNEQMLQCRVTASGRQKVRLQPELIETGPSFEQADGLRIAAGAPVNPAQETTGTGAVGGFEPAVK